MILKRRRADNAAGKTSNGGCRLSRANDCDLGRDLMKWPVVPERVHLDHLSADMVH